MIKHKIIYKNKPRKCPECGCLVIARILYGMPMYDAKMEKDIADGRLRLGGCCQEHSDPAWQCSDCDIFFYKKQDVSEEANFKRL